MKPFLIQDAKDPRLKPYRDLPRGGCETELFVVEGHFLVERLLASGLQVHSILVERGKEHTFDRGAAEVPVLTATAALMSEIVGFPFHRGVLACGFRPQLTNCEKFMEAPPLAVLACWGVQNAENLGGLFRTAAALGVNSILLGPGCADPFARRVLRVSMGAVFTLPCEITNFLEADLQKLADNDFELIAAVLDSRAEPLQSLQAHSRRVLVVGSEAAGLPESITRLCRPVTLPMAGGTDSLNVTVAAGIFLHRMQELATPQRISHGR